jgi:hypothetical protein
MKNKTYLIGMILIANLVSGCNFSPLSPSNRPNIRNNGDVGDIKNNQQGLMVELMNLKNRMDVMAQEIENIQNGFINHNNKNSGVQIFQGDGGLIAGLSSLGILAIVAIAYKLKSDKYRKTAELFGKQIKNMNNDSLERSVLASALANKVEVEVFKILKDQSKS